MQHWALKWWLTRSFLAASKWSCRAGHSPDSWQAGPTWPWQNSCPEFECRRSGVGPVACTDPEIMGNRNQLLLKLLLFLTLSWKANQSYLPLGSIVLCLSWNWGSIRYRFRRLPERRQKERGPGKSPNNLKARILRINHTHFLCQILCLLSLALNNIIIID